MAAPTSQQLMQWIKPEPASPQELEWVERLKPGEYEVYSERLANITMEAAEVFKRTGITSMLRSGDLVVGIYSPQGDMVTTSCGTYIHAVTAQLPIKYMIKNFTDEPTVGIKDGDIFYTNEALYGCIHNPDQAAVMPVFHKGELIAFVTAATHQPETGGTDPGGMCPSAKTKYDEGMRLSPIKIGENYRIRADILEMMENFISRSPRIQVTDVRARVTGCDRCRIRLQELAEEKGKEFLLGLFRKILITCEEAARKRIRSWNDGKYRVALFHDCVSGIYLGMNRAFVTLHKEDDHITFDYTGTSPENESSWQAFAHIVAAHSAIHIYSYIFHDLPVSCGTLAPLDWIVPEGTWLNATPSAAVSNSASAGGTPMVATTQLFSKLIFDSEQRELVGAAFGVSASAVIWAGKNQYGVEFADMIAWHINMFGQGARSNMDGMNACIFSWCNTGFSPDMEDFEAEMPIMWLYAKHAKDTGGFGKYQGGAGGGSAATLHGVPVMISILFGAGGAKIVVGQGLFGGYPPHPVPICRISATNLLEKLAKGDRDIPTNLKDVLTKRAIEGQYEVSHIVGVPPWVTMPGDLVVMEGAGASGYGDVLERDPELVVRDLRDEIISHRTAEKIYCVAYDPETLEVDYKRTKEMRKRETKRRLKRGKPYEEFEKEWQQKWPNTEIMEYFGSWPDATPVKEIIRI